MADLVMTIDSDSEVEAKPVKGTKFKKAKKPQEDEILLAHSVILQDTMDDEGISRKHTKGHFVGSNQLWNFGESYQTDRKPMNADDEDGATTADDKAPFQQTMEERVNAKIVQHGLNLPAELVAFRNSKNDTEENKVVEMAKEDPKIHYDKEDLISFHQLMISKPLTKAAHDLDFEHPTVIQRQVIPAILDGNDVLAHSVTGSGKTAAYLLPILEKFIKMKNAKAASIGKLRFLVLQPTRELAAQCYAMLQGVSKYLGNSFSSLAIYGGSSLRHQKRDLECTPDFIVATTGRLLDHIHNTKGFSLEDVEVLVLDEADRLIEMGFRDEVDTIVKRCTNPKRQTIMVSATLNQDLKELAAMTLKEALTFTVQQQQRKADLANLKLAQYLVRLKFDDVEKRAPRVTRRERDAQAKKDGTKKKRKRRDYMDKDFDSEEEYNSEVESQQ